MRVLLAHNFYQSASPSGEDSVFRNERSLLEAAGHTVIAYERHNDDIGAGVGSRARAAVDAVWSSRTHREVSALIEAHRPDVAHFHNTFPQISPSAYAACRSAGVPIVQTLHNYRLICPGALLMRNGVPCEECVGQSPLPAVKHACYRQSHVASGVVAAMLSIHRARDTYARGVERYIALTAFARQRLIRGGLPEEKIIVRPNCLMDSPAPGRGTGEFALYVGRLSPEKGVRTLIEAWREMEVPLIVAGDGVLRAELERKVQEGRLNVRFVGFQPRAEILRLMREARCLVIPSECYEGFPVTVLEALACGTPMVVAALGGLDEIVDAPRNGLKFSPRDPASLRASVRTLLADEASLARIRVDNRSLFEERYSPIRGLASLLRIYDAVRRAHARMDLAAQIA